MKSLPRGTVTIGRSIWGPPIDYYLTCPHCGRTTKTPCDQVRGDLVRYTVALRCPKCKKKATYATGPTVE